VFYFDGHFIFEIKNENYMFSLFLKYRVPEEEDVLSGCDQQIN